MISCQKVASSFCGYQAHSLLVFRPFSCAMLARIVVHVSLFSCLTAIRDDAALRDGLNTGAAIITDSMAGTVPLAVNSAIRKVNGRVSRKMMLSLGVG